MRDSHTCLSELLSLLSQIEVINEIPIGNYRQICETTKVMFRDPAPVQFYDSSVLSLWLFSSDYLQFSYKVVHRFLNTSVV